MSDPAAVTSHASPSRSGVRWLSPLMVALGTGLLAIGYLLDGPEPWAAIGAVVPGLLWMGARRWRSAPAADASFVAFVILAGLGLWFRVGAGWMLPAAVAGLAAWDLARLERRLAAAGHVAGRGALERRHLAHLLLVLVLGLTLALAGALWRLDLGFFPAFLLGVLAVAGLLHTIVYLRRGAG